MRPPEAEGPPPGLAGRLAGLSPGTLALLTTALAAVLEAATVVLRFGAGLEAQADPVRLGTLTGGWRIHHGVAGLLLLAAALPARRRPALRNALLAAGGALLLSDAVHHLLVLWPLTGDTGFGWRYGR